MCFRACAHNRPITGDGGASNFSKFRRRKIGRTRASSPAFKFGLATATVLRQMQREMSVNPPGDAVLTLPRASRPAARQRASFPFLYAARLICRCRQALALGLEASNERVARPLALGRHPTPAHGALAHAMNAPSPAPHPPIPPITPPPIA
jgi:hypothetical protein